MKILMVLTSHDQLGDTEAKTGIWLEEFTTPYYVFQDAGVKLTLASPQGGQPPLDPKSNEPDSETSSIQRFRGDKTAQAQFTQTVKLDQISADDYDAIFYPGGHGPLWDLAEDTHSIQLIEAFYQQGKPIGAVCHAPCVFRHTQDTQGLPLIQGKSVTGFSNQEEEAVQLEKVVPFLLEDELKAKGGNYSRGEAWLPYWVVDGQFITGQNPASSEGVAIAVLEALNINPTHE